MKNMKRWGGIVVLTLVVGLFLAGCPSAGGDSSGTLLGSTTEQDKFDGAWKKGSYTMTFSDGEWTLKDGATDVAKGKFLLLESSAMGTITHRWENNAWKEFEAPGVCSYSSPNANTLIISGSMLPKGLAGTWTK
jgi:hypothetical protein